MRRPIPLFLLGILATVAACGAAPKASAPLTLTGRVQQSSFASTVSSVQALRADVLAAEAAPAADGRFTLELPPASGYRLVFVHADGTSTLVFPRKSGALEQRFDVKGGAAFDLGVVRHIGDPSALTFAYRKTGTSDGDAVQCEDGVDPTTGAVCVDDDAGEAETCAEAEAASDADADQVECEDGIDPKTGAECDGGPAANADDGSEPSSEAEAAAAGSEAPPADAATADHNLPGAVGCAAEADADQVECEDGIDPKTGAECDGGPAANADDGNEPSSEPEPSGSGA